MWNALSGALSVVNNHYSLVIFEADWLVHGVLWECWESASVFFYEMPLLVKKNNEKQFIKRANLLYINGKKLADEKWKFSMPLIGWCCCERRLL